MVGVLDVPEYDRWLGTARSARASAEGLRGLGHHNWASFQAEQAAHLAVKGLLHATGSGSSAWGHDLPTLVQHASEIDDRLRAVAPAATRLSLLYVASRYPDALPGLSPEARFGPAESESALADAREVLGAVEGAWNALRDEAGGR